MFGTTKTVLTAENFVKGLFEGVVEDKQSETEKSKIGAWKRGDMGDSKKDLRVSAGRGYMKI